jgi:ribosomal protein S18 acetylase RimI-like enzyme
MSATAITLRPVRPENASFLFSIYASTRVEELARTPWNAEQRQAFLKMQFAAQQLHYQSYYPDAVHTLVLLDGQPIGRSYLAREDLEIRILDLTLLPEYRGAGIGARLVQDLMAEAALAGKSLAIYVESFNPSLRLFERLGFYKEENGIYFLMEWRPA